MTLFAPHWKDVNITPLRKKSSKQICSNYRPVTLISQVVKLLERLVQNQIFKHVKINDIIPMIPCDQHGEKHFLNELISKFNVGQKTIYVIVRAKY